MEITDKKQFIAEYAQLMSDKDYVEAMENCTKEAVSRRKSVFAKYTSMEGGHIVENQMYNEKNAAVEVLSILLETKDRLSKIKSVGIHYLIEEMDERIEGHTKMVETKIGGLSSGITMSVYTETDIILRGAEALDDIASFYEKAYESCKKEEKSDSTLSEVPEDNS